MAEKSERNFMDNLKNVWNSLAMEYTGDSQLTMKLWEELHTSYSEKNRAYHNLDHLMYMIDKAGPFRDQVMDIDTVMFSVFYHDIVYNVRRKDNEQRSADMAGDRLVELEVPASMVAKCQQQILATRSHESNTDEDTNFLVDLDLSILGDVRDVYSAYIGKIRSEYSIYPGFMYRKGRRAVLNHFLQQDRIFKTKEFHDLYEPQARENLQWELDLL